MERYCFSKCACDNNYLSSKNKSCATQNSVTLEAKKKNGQSKKENNRISAEQIRSVSGKSFNLAGCKENHFYCLPFGQAEASIY